MIILNHVKKAEPKNIIKPILLYPHNHKTKPTTNTPNAAKDALNKFISIIIRQILYKFGDFALTLHRIKIHQYLKIRNSI